MSKDVAKVVLLNRGEKTDITEMLAGNQIYVTLSNGGKLTVEFFERDNVPGINIYGDDILVQPRSGNVVRIIYKRLN